MLDSLSFLINTYRQVEQTSWCLARLRLAYPHVRVVVISDGDPDAAYGDIARAYAAELHYGDHLKIPERGTAFLARQIKLSIDTGAERIIKIDPDTWVHRPFDRIPAADFAGSLRRRSPFHPIVQGGCQLLSRRACERLLSSGILEDGRYADGLGWSDSPLVNFWVRVHTACYKTLNTDFLLADMMRRVGITAVDWDECGCRWRSEPGNARLRYAVTHPHRIDRSTTRPEFSACPP